MSLEFSSRTEDDTHRLGLAIADCLEPGTPIGLSGTLGAGKTRLVQAIAAGLGIEQGSVVSPTFALIQSHEGRLPLVHVDLYRVKDEDEFAELGVDEYFDTSAIVVIEWAERFASSLPPDLFWIGIQIREQDRLFRLGTGVDAANQASSVAKKFLDCLAKRLPKRD